MSNVFDNPACQDCDGNCKACRDSEYALDELIGLDTDED